MVKKRKKRKPKKRTPRGRGSLASASGTSGERVDSADAEDDDAADGGLSARGLLLDALADTPEPGEARDEDSVDSSESDPDEDATADEGESEAASTDQRKLPDRPVQIPLLGDGSDEEDEEDEEDDDRGGDPAAGDDEEYEEDLVAAAQMGSARYVTFGFFALWLVAGYVAGQALMSFWGFLAHREWFMSALPAVAAVPYEGELVSRASVSLVLGGLIAGLIVLYYYLKQDVRQWADEVAEQLGKVKWPTRKEVGNHTVVVLAVAAVLTTILALLDRFWGFVTNLIYSSGL